MSKAFCFVPVRAGIYTKGINQFMQKMSFLWNVYCGYFNSGLSRSSVGSLVRCAPSYEGTLVNAPIACEIFRCIVIQTRAEWIFLFIIVVVVEWVWFRLAPFGSYFALFLLEVKWMCVTAAVHWTHSNTFRHTDTQHFFLAGAGAVTVLSVASVIYDAIRFLLGQQIAKHQTS